MPYFNFEKLEVYQIGLRLASKIYEISKNWPREEMFGLTGQIRRSSVSVSLNIAEGSSRTKKDFRHFLDLSRGSCYEVVATLTIAKDLGYLNQDNYNELYQEINKLTMMINGLKNSIK